MYLFQCHLSSIMSTKTHFGVVDQAMKSMKTVEEYINVGMETTLHVGMDFVENDKGNIGYNV